MSRAHRSRSWQMTHFRADSGVALESMFIATALGGCGEILLPQGLFRGYGGAAAEVRECLPGLIETCPLSPASAALKGCSRFKVLGLSNQSSVRTLQRETMAEYRAINAVTKEVACLVWIYSLPDTIQDALLGFCLEKKSVLWAVFFSPLSAPFPPYLYNFFKPPFSSCACSLVGFFCHYIMFLSGDAFFFFCLKKSKAASCQRNVQAEYI